MDLPRDIIIDVLTRLPFLTPLQSLKYNDKNGLTKRNIAKQIFSLELVIKAPRLSINPLRGGEFLELPMNDLVPPYARKLYGI
ncbi:hypothetical protein L3X38_039756 [Prunus dulcis]|uniref:F-box domain-containing protein n=1 Tax=Prunus dulcis TaxID=3755 RepID=A0AAD4YTF1_PRUDU|nr:hypothetical protein L3X38_039756 [Prunus dulcis]